MADVFISYSRKDQPFVKRLDEALRQRKREAWVDWEGIRPTEEFMRAIYAAIEGADTFLFILSPDSVSSAVCGKEIAHAVAQNKRMVPIVARDVNAAEVPEALAKLNWIFCRDTDDFAQATATLISALDTDLDWVRAHTRLLTRAVEWEAKGRNDSFVLRSDDLRAAEQWLAQAGADKERQPTPLQTIYIIASRQAAARRQRITLGAVTFGAVLATVLAIVAFFQRAEAVKQEGFAKAGRNRATDVIRFVQNNLPEKLRPIGRLDLMGDVAVHVEKYYEAMQAAEGESVETLTGRSWAAANQGFIIGEQQGHLEEAIVKYRAALALAEKARLLQPGSEKAVEYETKMRQVLALALEQARWSGTVKPAMPAVGKQASPQTAGNPVANEASMMSQYLEMAKSLYPMAERLEAQGQFDSALAALREATEAMRKLTSSDPGNFEWQRDLALSYQHTGMFLQMHGQPALALDEYQKHAETMAKVAARDPGNRVWQREAAEALSWVARACHDIVIAQFVAGKKGDFGAARVAVERGLGVLATLEKSGPLPTDMTVLRENLKNFGSQLPAPASAPAK